MKSKLLSLTFIFFTFFAVAQQYKYQVEAHLGSSLFGNLSRMTFKNIQTQSISYNVTPVVGLSGYINLSKSTALGVSINNQTVGLQGHLDTIADFYLKLNRLNLSVDGRYYYLKRNGWQLYSSLRVGATIWRLKTGVSAEQLNKIVDQYADIPLVADYVKKQLEQINNLSGTWVTSMLSLQVTLLGVAKQLGPALVFGQLAIGSPYYFNFGLAFSFFKQR